MIDPKNPYASRDFSSDESRYRVLKETTIVQLDKLRRTLQILVVTLVLGVLSFGGFAVFNGEGPRTFFGPDRMDIMLGLVVICAVSSILVPFLVGQSSRGTTANVQPALQNLLTGEPDHDHAIFKAQRIQLTAIIGCSMLEGVAFANLFVVMTKQDFGHLLVAAILLVGIMLRFPTRSRYLRRIDPAGEIAFLKQPDRMTPHGMACDRRCSDSIYGASPSLCSRSASNGVWISAPIPQS